MTKGTWAALVALPVVVAAVVVGAFSLSRSSSTTHAYACVTASGIFEYQTIRTDARAARRACPHPTDTLRSWVRSTAISARVSTSGALVAGSHAISSARVSAIAYRITFDRDISRCTYHLDSTNASGEAATSRAHVGPANQLTIGVVGLARDDAFGLQVSC